MALNTFIRNYLTPLKFEGLRIAYAICSGNPWGLFYNSCGLHGHHQ